MNPLARALRREFAERYYDALDALLAAAARVARLNREVASGRRARGASYQEAELAVMIAVGRLCGVEDGYAFAAPGPVELPYPQRCLVAAGKRFAAALRSGGPGAGREARIALAGDWLFGVCCAMATLEPSACPGCRGKIEQDVAAGKCPRCGTPRVGP